MDKLTIGVAIPCYKKHIPFVFKVLDSIEKQTRKPEKVVISCSSTISEDFPLNKLNYSFPIEIYVIRFKKNAAQNRNNASSYLDTDIVTFIDADDIMHPQRLEIIERVFIEHSPKIFLHGYQEDTQEFMMYQDIPIEIGKLSKCQWGATIYTGNYSARNIHNSQSSVQKSVLENIQYPEQLEYVGKEDTIFCTSVIEKYINETAYCPLSLSYYNSSASWNDYL